MTFIFGGIASCELENGAKIREQAIQELYNHVKGGGHYWSYESFNAGSPVVNGNKKCNVLSFTWRSKDRIEGVSIDIKDYWFVILGTNTNLIQFLNGELKKHPDLGWEK
jgi:hypothetical protein